MEREKGDFAAAWKGGKSREIRDGGYETEQLSQERQLIK